ncbi:hypothetical protein ACT54M_14755 [Leptospira santarosai]|uniref:hypothetical protein n=1 Tax=Leptospira santarosai TaxID=28183 RepID=UPI000967B72E|nr:hypothetical protein [Leptospira santarosai]OLY61466.1 hypothetical protein BV917_05080 [Leptospira santarosai serovar Guaricura]
MITNEQHYNFIQKYKNTLFKKLTRKYPEYERLRKYLLLDYPTPNEFVILGGALLISWSFNIHISAIWTRSANEYILKKILESGWHLITIIKNRKGYWHTLNVNGYNGKEDVFICDDPHGNIFMNYKDLNGKNLKFKASHLIEINYGNPVYIASSFLPNEHQRLLKLFDGIPHYRIDF